MAESSKISPQLKAELQEIEAAKKNSARFAPLYDRYYKQIFLFIFKRTSHRDLAGDLTAQTFLKAMVNLKKYEFRGYPFSSWLYRIAVNEINMYYRSLKKQVTVEIRESDVLLMMDEMEVGMDEDRQQMLVSALNELDAESTQLIECRYFEQMSFNEIGSVFNITEANAKVRVYRILKKLKKIITLKGEQS